MTKTERDRKKMVLILVLGAGIILVKLLFPEATQNIAR